jgi:hypothetical protein
VHESIYTIHMYVVCGTNFITVCRACLGHFNYCSSLYGENNNKKDLLKDRFRILYSMYTGEYNFVDT